MTFFKIISIETFHIDIDSIFLKPANACLLKDLVFSIKWRNFQYKEKKFSISFILWLYSRPWLRLTPIPIHYKNHCPLEIYNEAGVSPGILKGVMDEKGVGTRFLKMNRYHVDWPIMCGGILPKNYIFLIFSTSPSPFS